MPARDTYSVEVTVRDEYEGQLLYERWEEYLAPGQPLRATMASVMRASALKLAPESGDSRSVEAIHDAIDAARAAALAETVGPATRTLLIDQLWRLAESLDIDWYGYRGD